MTSIEGIKPLRNHVLIRISRGAHKLRLKGIDLNIDVTFNPEHHVTVKGIVAALPEQLEMFSPKADNMHAMMWETTIETKPGDLVWFDYMAAMDALGPLIHPLGLYNSSKYMIIPPGDLYIFVHYSKLYAVQEGMDLKMLNGYVCIEWTDIKETIGYQIRKKSRVIYNGSNNGKYYDGYRREVKDAIVEPGDLVHTRKYNGTLLEHPDHKEFELDLRLIQKRDIIARDARS